MPGLVTLERRLRKHYDVAPVDTETWARARIYNLWFDHAVLRGIWTNEAEIAPGVWRSNHPTPARLRAWRDRGLKAVLTLRGDKPTAHYLTERAYCDELGFKLHALGFSDKHAPAAQGLLDLIALFRSIERPFLIHCKSGADRAGLAATLYLHVIEGRPLADARRMLSPRFLHFRGSKAGILDALLDHFEATAEARDFETWLRDSYDHLEFEADYQRARSAPRAA